MNSSMSKSWLLPVWTPKVEVVASQVRNGTFADEIIADDDWHIVSWLVKLSSYRDHANHDNFDLHREGCTKSLGSSRRRL